MSTGLMHGIALVAYLGAAVLYGANLTLQQPRYTPRARGLLLAAILLHTAAIGLFCVNMNQSPFASNFGTLSIAAWAIALVFLPLDLRSRVPALGAVAVPVVCLLLFGGLARSGGPLRTVDEIRLGIVSIHILLLLFSFALFALSACCAVLYIYQYGALKHPDRRGMFRRLPPLGTLDHIAVLLAGFGLPLLTLGIVLGIVRAAAGGLPANWLADSHTWGSFVVWGLYAVALGGRAAGTLRGLRPHWLLVSGLVVILLLFAMPSPSHTFE